LKVSLRTKRRRENGNVFTTFLHYDEELLKLSSRLLKIGEPNAIGIKCKKWGMQKIYILYAYDFT
jgi:hypothetical protein